MFIIFYVCLLGQLITTSIHLHAADYPLEKSDAKKNITHGPPLSLEKLCKQTLKHLPPEHFKQWQDMPFHLKQQFIIEHGLTYKPILFVLDEATQNSYKVDGTIQNQLKLCNHFAQLIIGKQKSDEHDQKKELLTYELFDPDFRCACLKAKHIYVGSERGKIYHYSIEQCVPELVDTQQVSPNPISYITAHPSIEHLIACSHSDGNMCIFQKNEQGPWVNQKELTPHQPTKGITFCPSGKWLACVDNYSVYIYDLTSASRDEKHKLTHVANNLEALLFKDETLIMNSKSDKFHQRLTVWNLKTDTKPSSSTVWTNTSKIVLNHHGCYGFDKDFENNEWVNHTSSQILFELVLDHIQSLQELDTFKNHMDKLHCGEQPLFNLIAITNKTAELKKAEKKRKHSADVLN